MRAAAEDTLMATPSIDRDKLRVFVRRLEDADLLILLDRAIDLLPASRLGKLIEDYARPADLRPDGSAPTDLLEAVRRFHAASLRREYYEDFMVNSKNYREMSKGTQRWIAECQRLLDLCMGASSTDRHAETRAAFELIFDLLGTIDDGGEEIVFFADEAGSWQVGVNWRKVMPAWFPHLAATSLPDDYAASVHAMISYFSNYDEKNLVEAARRCADKAQEVALARLPPAKRSYHRPRFERS
jgi:hypothetical protein